MSRIEENKETLKTISEASEVRAYNKTDVILLGFIVAILSDISTSLAVIADKAERSE